MNSQLNPNLSDPSTLPSLLNEYKKLKGMQDQLQERVLELRKRINNKMEHQSYMDGKYVYQNDALKAELITVDRTTLDEHRAAEVLYNKGLNWCFKEVPDPDLVEQAYLQGLLTDSDLRYMRNPQYTKALRVTDV